MVAHAVLLRATAIVNLMKQVGISQTYQGAEQRRTVNRRQSVFQIRKAERVMKRTPHLAPHKQSHSCHAHAGLLQHPLIIMLVKISLCRFCGPKFCFGLINSCV